MGLFFEELHLEIEQSSTILSQTPNPASVFFHSSEFFFFFEEAVLLFGSSDGVVGGNSRNS